MGSAEIEFSLKIILVSYGFKLPHTNRFRTTLITLELTDLRLRNEVKREQGEKVTRGLSNYVPRFRVNGVFIVLR